MKFLVPAALLTLFTLNSALAQVRSQASYFAGTTAARPAGRVVLKAAPQTVSRLVSFVASPIVATAPSVLVESYFYEGQYVRRGQVLAKLRVRSSNAITYLNAPHDGVLARAQAQVGEVLTPQTPLTTLTDQTRPLVRLHPAAAQQLHPGDSVQVTLANTLGAPVRGKVTGWGGTTAKPELQLQLRKSVAGAAVGTALSVAANPAGAAATVAEVQK
ncbi:HlyD family efflux transporter periplasmic adaptor subunit [Hymenobacter chitinivorans]|uniref:HlyD family secretion protein n=1 Tax=Hymenobacter chitinivorans DSM 11115 TaxID=1121954 RepID=A0A2M9BMQ6_9BACT|nr:HlyD family efflux transporter periplasmic adaptor subunit [Hymenobacter chitinivorans]PJJ59243.1 HlyD family secretion protein [Hymenobacter chitinivorans DSM 11115]